MAMGACLPVYISWLPQDVTRLQCNKRSGTHPRNDAHSTAFNQSSPDTFGPLDLLRLWDFVQAASPAFKSCVLVASCLLKSSGLPKLSWHDWKKWVSPWNLLGTSASYRKLQEMLWPASVLPALNGTCQCLTGDTRLYCTAKPWSSTFKHLAHLDQMVRAPGGQHIPSSSEDGNLGFWLKVLLYVASSATCCTTFRDLEPTLDFSVPAPRVLPTMNLMPSHASLIRLWAIMGTSQELSSLWSLERWPVNQFCKHKQHKVNLHTLPIADIWCTMVYLPCLYIFVPCIYVFTGLVRQSRPGFATHFK